MAKMSRKDELGKIISEAQAELKELEAEEMEKRNSALIGQHLKYRNSYSGLGKRKDHWWVYLKVTAIDDFGIFCFSFQRCHDEKIEINPGERFGINALSDFRKISKEEFENAWRGLLNMINHQAWLNKIFWCPSR